MSPTAPFSWHKYGFAQEKDQGVELTWCLMGSNSTEDERSVAGPRARGFGTDVSSLTERPHHTKELSKILKIRENGAD